MLNVIDFLEKLGSEAHWGNASEDDVALALTEANIEGPAHSAVLAKDVPKLQELLRQAPLFSTQIPPDEEGDEEDEHDDSDEKLQPKGIGYSSSGTPLVHA